MKYLFFIAVLAFVGMVGCVKNEPHIQDDGEKSVSFMTIVGKSKSKALILGGDYPTDETFGSSAFMSYGDFDSEYASAGLYIDEAEIECQDNKWTAKGAAYYWPKAAKLTFFSYSPYDELNASTEITATDGVVISSWDVAANQDVDVMVAGPAKDRTYGNSAAGVTTEFRHKLSRIMGFKFRLNESDLASKGVRLYIKTVRINNIYTKGTYTSSNGVSGTERWEPVGEKSSYIWYHSETPTIEPQYSASTYPTTVEANRLDASAESLLVLPQTFTNVGTVVPNIEVVYVVQQDRAGTLFATSEKRVYADLYDVHGSSGNALLMNKQITYQIEINVSENRIYWAPSVIDWDTEVADATN